jgi:hypothetical protein
MFFERSTEYGGMVGRGESSEPVAIVLARERKNKKARHTDNKNTPSLPLLLEERMK